MNLAPLLRMAPFSQKGSELLETADSSIRSVLSSISFSVPTHQVVMIATLVAIGFAVVMALYLFAELAGDRGARFFSGSDPVETPDQQSEIQRQSEIQLLRSLAGSLLSDEAAGKRRRFSRRLKRRVRSHLPARELSNGAPPPAEANSDADDEVLRCPVRYLSGRNNLSLLPWIPWDASGTLTASEDRFHFAGSSSNGHHLELDFDPNETLVNYQTGTKFWDGGLTWCVIEVEGEKHYFTSESSFSAKRQRYISLGGHTPAREGAPENGPKVTRRSKAKTLSTGELYRYLTDRYIKDS